jgi:hypothetical protein
MNFELDPWYQSWTTLVLTYSPQASLFGIFLIPCLLNLTNYFETNLKNFSHQHITGLIFVLSVYILVWEKGAGPCISFQKLCVDSVVCWSLGWQCRLLKSWDDSVVCWSLGWQCHLLKSWDDSVVCWSLGMTMSSAEVWGWQCRLLKSWDESVVCWSLGDNAEVLGMTVSSAEVLGMIVSSAEILGMIVSSAEVWDESVVCWSLADDSVVCLSLGDDIVSSAEILGMTVSCAEVLGMIVSSAEVGDEVSILDLSTSKLLWCCQLKRQLASRCWI